MRATREGWLLMLAQVLGDPALVRDFRPAQWERLMREARYARLMARLWATLSRAELDLKPPPAFLDAVNGASVYADFLQHRARYEVEMLGRLAAQVDYPVVLLKGAAYIAEGNSAAAGRSLSDIDLLVPQDAIRDFEQRLEAADWSQKGEFSDYDDFYYRNYSHEIPPLWNPEFHYELDVHHNIIQPTHRFSVNAAQLLAGIRPLDGTPFHLLSRFDQLLHSATHLMMNDELRGGLRDVHDIVLLHQDGLAADDTFSCGLVSRALELGLQRSLYYALDYARRDMSFAFPEPDWAELATAAPAGPADLFMRHLIRHKLMPSAAQSHVAVLAEQLLYIRSHWIRMPPLRLARHLLRKAAQGERKSQLDDKPPANT